MERRRYATPTGYRARDYWQARLAAQGFDLWESTAGAFTEEEDLPILPIDGDLVLDVCRKHDVHLPTARVLDAGCGAGSCTGILRAAGVRTYTGVDIVSTLFDGLRGRYPEFAFSVVDICERLVEGEFDLILLLNVAQHIVDEHRFSFALRNLKLALSPDGVILIAAPLGPYQRRSFHTVIRPLEAFTRHFPGWTVGEAGKLGSSTLFVLRRIDGR
jgi:SAM-dependent methyltransferase